MSYSDPLAPRTSLSEEVDGLGTQLANLDLEYAPRDEILLELQKRDRALREQAEMTHSLRLEVYSLRKEFERFREKTESADLYNAKRIRDLQSRVDTRPFGE